MKYFILLLFFFVTTKGVCQVPPASTMPTTTSLPQGTSVKNGKIIVLPGYKAFFSEKDKKVLHIQRISTRSSSKTGIILGSFSCKCGNNNEGDCQVVIGDNSIACYGKTCTDCKLVISVNSAGGTATSGGSKDEIWKRFVFPNKTDKRQ